MLPTIVKRQQQSHRQSMNNSRRSSSVPVRALQPHLATPSECQIPHFKEKQIIHRPTLLQQTSAGSIVMEGQVGNKPQDAVLDGFVMLESTGLALPDDVIYIVLKSKRFTKVVEGDLVFFNGLLHLDLSENYLELASFGCLPALKELRLACNAMRDIYAEDLGDGFPSLTSLDLSYNSLTTSSILALGRIPFLKELDLSGNKLTELPASMADFKCLEKLVLENNKFDDVRVFQQLATAPNLREIGLAYNFLWKFPAAAGFKMLEVLDVAFNYFGTEEHVEGVLKLPRLRSVVLYGNPLLGPTGEDPHFIYIEDLAEAAWARAYGPSAEAEEGEEGTGVDAYQRKPLEIVTEIPKKRTYTKGQDLGRRRVAYRDFTMAVVDRTAAERVGGKLARDWISEGNNTLFAQAVALAQAQLGQGQAGDSRGGRRSRPTSPGGPELTFLTRPPGEPDPYATDGEDEDGEGVRGRSGEGNRGQKENTGRGQGQRQGQGQGQGQGRKSNIADGIVSFTHASGDGRGGASGTTQMANIVMGKVAQELGIGTGSGTTSVGRAMSNDILMLNTRAGIKSTPASRALSSSLATGPGDANDGEADGGGVGGGAAFADDDAAGSGSARQRHNPQVAVVPDFVLRRTLTEAHTLKAPSELLAVKTAVRALRFAVRNPLTNYYEEPTRDFMAPLDYVSGTAASASRVTSNKVFKQARAVERQHTIHAVTAITAATGGFAKGGRTKNQGQRSAHTRTPLVLDGDLSVVGGARSSGPTTLLQLDHILDTLNLAAHSAVARGSGEGHGQDAFAFAGSPQKRPGSSHTGLSNLIKMVNDVMDTI